MIHMILTLLPKKELLAIKLAPHQGLVKLDDTGT